ncbi:MAG: bifunctional hydroxymethylpyrimidine kinase/phosphomethylpyrimidine kinase, partial [Akkermansiaceae bacterium]
AAAQAIAEKHQLACLLKGGHLTGQSELLDVLWCDGEAHEYRHPVVRTDGGFHGTGCTLSAAITANLAKGDTVPQAVQNGIDYLQKLMANSVAWQSEGKEVRVLGW